MCATGLAVAGGSADQTSSPGTVHTLQYVAFTYRVSHEIFSSLEKNPVLLSDIKVELCKIILKCEF